MDPLVRDDRALRLGLAEGQPSGNGCSRKAHWRFEANADAFLQVTPEEPHPLATVVVSGWRLPQQLVWGRSRVHPWSAGGSSCDSALGQYSDLVELTQLIETRPGVRSGKPCFVGTRIAVYDVLDYLAAGMTSDEIVADFPELSDRHVRAAIEFAALRERRLAAPA